MTPEEQEREDRETQSVIARVWLRMEREQGIDWVFWIFVALLLVAWMISEYLRVWG